MSRRDKRRGGYPKSREDRQPVLGIDVGGVLVDRVAQDKDTSFFGDRPMETPVVPRAFDAVAALCSDHFEYRVHIVSKAGPKIAALTREWLGHTGFFARTGVSPGNVHFVRRRPDKGPVCAALGITHFVDDHVDVLVNLCSVQHRFLFLGGISLDARPSFIPEGMAVAEDWTELREMIVSTL